MVVAGAARFRIVLVGSGWFRGVLDGSVRFRAFGRFVVAF